MKKLGKIPTTVSYNSVVRSSKYLITLMNPKWKALKHKFIDSLGHWKTLATVARRYLSSPQSSVASNSLFSEIKVIDSNRRRRLLNDKVEMLTFIKCNLLSVKNQLKTNRPHT